MGASPPQPGSIPVLRMMGAASGAVRYLSSARAASVGPAPLCTAAENTVISLMLEHDLVRKVCNFRDYALTLLRHKFVGCAKSRCEALAACATARRDFAHATGRQARGCTPYAAFMTQ